MPKHYDLALEQRGVKEFVGIHRDNPVVMQFYKDVKHGGIEHDEVPWCAAFVGAMLERCNIKSSRSLLARSYLKWGKSVKNPKPGDIVVYWRESRKSYKGHVGFFVGFDEDTGKVLTLGGNQGNKVSIRGYPAHTVLGYRRVKMIKPPFKPQPPQGVEMEDTSPSTGQRVTKAVKDSWTLKGGAGALVSLLAAISQLNPAAQIGLLLTVAFIVLMMWRRIDAAIKGKIG